MRIFITGGTGYLGSHLVYQLLKNKNTVACVVRNKEQLGRLDALKEEILIVSPEEMTMKIPDFFPEVVIHTACVYSRGEFTEKEIFRGNLSFPFEVLQLARTCGVKKWINTASSLPCMTNSYSLSKEQLTQWGKFYSGAGEMSFVNLRLEHFYGKNAPQNNFLTWVIAKLKNNEPLNLTLGTQKRDFIHVDDVLRVYDAVLKKDFKENYIDIPVGTGETPSIREVVEYLKGLIGSKSELYFGAIPMRKEEPESHCDTKMIQAIGVWPFIGWKEGLKKII